MPGRTAGPLRLAGWDGRVSDNATNNKKCPLYTYPASLPHLPTSRKPLKTELVPTPLALQCSACLGQHMPLAIVNDITTVSSSTGLPCSLPVLYPIPQSKCTRIHRTESPPCAVWSQSSPQGCCHAWALLPFWQIVEPTSHIRSTVVGLTARCDLCDCPRQRTRDLSS